MFLLEPRSVVRAAFVAGRNKIKRNYWEARCRSPVFGRLLARAPVPVGYFLLPGVLGLGILGLNEGRKFILRNYTGSLVQNLLGSVLVVEDRWMDGPARRMVALDSGIYFYLHSRPSTVLVV